MVNIKSLKDTHFEQLAEAFQLAFSNYEISMNNEELKRLLHRRGFSPVLSFGAFENDKLISFTLNGIGDFNGIKTAYDTGTGTLPDFQGQNLAARIFEYSLPYLRNAGINQYLLEVLQKNSKAISIYKKVGFKVSREFNYFEQSAAAIRISEKILSSDISLKETDLITAKEKAFFCDFSPSWQNSFQAIELQPDEFKIFGAFAENELIGYGIFEPLGGDITQLAVAKSYRRQGIASLLLKNLLTFNKNARVKAINTEISCLGITAFFEAVNIPLCGQQYEMIRDI
jgi:ribosomal protein S18 acetylase RimI-like enzyme